MPASSFSTSNVKDTQAKAFYSGIGSVRMDWEKTFDWDFTPGKNAIRKAPMVGVGNLPVWDGKANLDQAEPDALDAQLQTYVIYGIQIRLSTFDLEEVPDLERQTLLKAGFSVASTVSAAAAVAKANAFSVADIHGGKTFFAVDHETRSGAPRINRFQAALDRSSFLLGTSMIEKWVNYDNQLHDLSAAGYYLEFPTDLKETAKQAIRSAVTSSQNQYNAAADEDVEFIRNGYLGDDNDWILSVRAPGFKPWFAWERKAVQVLMHTDHYNNRRLINVFLAVGFGNKGEPSGAVGAKVT